MSSQDPRFVTTLTEATEPRSSGAADAHVGADESPTVALSPAEPFAGPTLDIDSLLGRSVGRYLVLERLGAGGMGVVLRAYDPDLGRQVALKVLSSEASGGSTQHERLYHEAQALARLAHENVVAVHDVGRHEGCVFVAMELIQGLTLRDWLRAEPRTRREILQVFCAAGRGLAAAHAAGLVHRDFKPANVMVGRDARVRVLDFGLARGLSSSLQAFTAHTGHEVLVGTPLYMSPEQLRQGVATAASDQFCFCISLWEALCGARPFAGGGTEALLENIAAGRFEPVRTRLPAWLRKVLVRGLAHDPGARFASMDALLSELVDKPAMRRRRTVSTISAALVTGVVLLVAARVKQARETVQARCESAGEAMQAVWNPDQKARLAHAFSERAGPYGGDSAARVARLIDGYAQGWQAMSRESCLATLAHDTQSESLLDRRSACLDRRRIGLGALLERFIAARDVDTVSGAVPAVFALPKLADCADLEALTASRRPPSAPAAVREIERVRTVLARAEAYQLAGQPSEALAQVEPLRAPVRALDWAPLELELEQLRAGLLTQLPERMGDAEAAYDQALGLAARSGDDHAAASLWVELIGALGGNLGKPLDALAERRAAELALARIHARPDDLRRADLAQNAAFSAWRAGRFDEARVLAQASLTVRERVLGRQHIDVASALVVLGLALQDDGDLDGAAVAGERALSVRRAALGNDHPKVAISLDQLAVTRVLQGRLDEAIALHREALAVQERVLGPDHPDVGMSLNNLGSLHLDMGKYDEAERLLTRALSIWQRSLAPLDPDFAIVHLNLGQLALGREDAVRAQEACSEALRIDEAALGNDTPVLAWDYTCLGDAAVLAGTPRTGLPLLERALELRAEAPPLERADTQIALSRALTALRLEPQRARELAHMAHEAYAQAGPVAALRLARSEQVLLTLAR